MSRRVSKSKAKSLAEFGATMHLAIDPSQRRSAIAWCDPRDSIRRASWCVVGSVEEIGRCEALRSLAVSGEPLAEVRLLALIECPTWNGPGTKEVRAAAIAFERELQRLFPKRKIVRVDPKEWQMALLSGAPTMAPRPTIADDRRQSATKLASQWYAGRVLGLPVGDDPDLADAVCILEYLRCSARVGR